MYHYNEKQKELVSLLARITNIIIHVQTHEEEYDDRSNDRVTSDEQIQFNDLYSELAGAYNNLPTRLKKIADELECIIDGMEKCL